MHDISAPLVINLDQTPLSYVSPEKYTFSFKGAKNVPIKGIDDKRQITATFAVSLTGKFLPIQLIYKAETQRTLSAPSHLVTERINGRTPKNHLSFSRNLSFFFSRWLKEKMDTQKNNTLL